MNRLSLSLVAGILIAILWPEILKGDRLYAAMPEPSLKPASYKGPQPTILPCQLMAPENNTTTAAYTLIDEDFSAITDGNIEQPDMSKPLCSYSDYSVGPYIPVNFKSGTWSGDNVYPAGGAIALSSPGVLESACLNTPFGDYSGDLNISFRIKLIGNANGYVYLYVCNGDIMNPFTSQGENCSSGFNLYPNDTNWTEVAISCRNLSANNDGFFQIVVSAGGTVVIDDLKITSTPNFIAAPIVEATTFTSNSFFCNWQPVRRAFDYHFRLYEKSYGADSEMDTEYDFEDLNTDGSNLPSNWYFSHADKSVIPAPGEGRGGSTGIKLCPGDTIMTMNNNTRYTEAVFWVKAVFADQKEAEDDYESAFYVEGWTGKKWIPAANFYMSFLTGGDDISMNETAEEYMYEFANIFKWLRFTLRDCDPSTYAILDEFCFTTPPSESYTLVHTYDGYDYTLVDTPYFEAIFNCNTDKYPYPGLDPNKDYMFEVRSHYLFERSEYVSGDATGTLRPVPTEASDVTENSFVANWQPVPHTEYYIVENYGVEVAKSDVEDAIILSEDFSKASSVMSDPSYFEALDNLEPIDLMEYTQQAGWVGRNTILINNMLGMKGKGYLCTPPLNLSNNESFQVHVVGYATAADVVNITTASGKVYQIPVPGQSEMNRFDEWIEIPECSDSEMLTFTSNLREAVLFDEISLCQSLKAGKRIYTYLSSETTDASSTSALFSNLEASGFKGFAYRVGAVRTVNGEPVSGGVGAFKSIGTPEKTTPSSDTDIIQALPAGIREIYTPTGIRLSAPTVGLNILIMDDGSVRKVMITE